MIISESKKYLLLHVPKTGGTSVKNAFKQIDLKGENDVIVGPRQRLLRQRDGSVVCEIRRGNNFEVIQRLPWSSDVARRGAMPLVKHSTLPEVASFFADDFYQSLRKVIVVRNPYSRIYSAYRFKLRVVKERNKVRDPVLGADGLPMSFEAFLENGVCRRVMASTPQVEWLGEGTVPDVVLRTETLAEDIFGAMISLGYAKAEAEAVRATLLSDRLNVSTDPDEWKTMSDQARELIARIYREDFEFFGYDRNAGA